MLPIVQSNCPHTPPHAREASLFRLLNELGIRAIQCITSNVDAIVHTTLPGLALLGRDQLSNFWWRGRLTSNPKFAKALGVLEALKMIANSLFPFLRIFNDAHGMDNQGGSLVIITKKVSLSFAMR